MTGPAPGRPDATSPSGKVLATVTSMTPAAACFNRAGDARRRRSMLAGPPTVENPSAWPAIGTPSSVSSASGSAVAGAHRRWGFRCERYTIEARHRTPSAVVASSDPRNENGRLRRCLEPAGITSMNDSRGPSHLVRASRLAAPPTKRRPTAHAAGRLGVQLRLDLTPSAASARPRPAGAPRGRCPARAPPAR